MFLLKDYDKPEGQFQVQLWHATGAFKMFGKDGTNQLPCYDAAYHKGYDLVTVSSEEIREAYASAFSIDESKVQALGVARTDELFDPDFRFRSIDKVFKAHPELKGKDIILYAPTFRDTPVYGRSVFIPDLDFNKLSKSLSENQLFVICPHPVITKPIVSDNFANIKEIRDVTTNEMMFVSKMMITDYSSVIFEYSLLNKPIGFYCFDFDRYNRDFYIDYEKDLPGPILKTEEDLLEFINSKEDKYSNQHELFKERYLNACDGKSAIRIARIIDDYIQNG